MNFFSNKKKIDESLELLIEKIRAFNISTGWAMREFGLLTRVSQGDRTTHAHWGLQPYF